MTLPIQCSVTHPFRIKEPSLFSEKGIPDLISEGWQKRRDKWESIFRYWIVQGIEIFKVLEITQLPLSFWNDLIHSLRKDFPYICFITNEKLTDEEHQKMLSVGFSDHNKLLAPQKTNQQSGLSSKEPDKRLSSVEKPSINCRSSDPQLNVSLEKIGDKKLLLTIDNMDPSIKRSTEIHIEDSGKDNIRDESIYYLQDLADGRTYRWQGKNNHIMLKAGELEKKFLIKLN